jgi:hypothetical protein
MVDRPRENFLSAAAAECLEIQRDADALSMVPRPRAGGAPDVYDGLFRDVEHLVLAPDGTVAVAADAVVFTITFPADYLHSGDHTLLYRVARLHSPLFHPNVGGGGAFICLGTSFRPGTRLRTLVHQLYGIVGCQNFATDSPLDAEAAAYYLAHLDAVRALRARPLWRRRIARNVVRSGAEPLERGAR